MDEPTTSGPVKQNDILNATDLRSEYYVKFINRKVEKFKQIVENVNITKCLHRLVIFETMTFLQQLSVLEFTCRFLLTEDAASGELLFSFDLSQEVLQAIGLHLPNKIRFYYVVDSDITGGRKLTSVQRRHLHRLHNELVMVMTFIKNVRDPTKRLMIFLSQMED